MTLFSVESQCNNLSHTSALVVRDYDEAIEFFTKTLSFVLLEDTYQPAQDKRWVLVAPAQLQRNRPTPGGSLLR